MVAYLCHFLDENEEKPWKVLKAAGLTPKTDADWHTPDVVNTMYTAAHCHIPQALDTDSEVADDSDVQSEDFDSDADKFRFSFSVFCGNRKRTGIVFMIFLSLYVFFLRFLTWRARHSQLLFAARICFLFCNQLAFERLVIRRAV